MKSKWRITAEWASWRMEQWTRLCPHVARKIKYPGHPGGFLDLEPSSRAWVLAAKVSLCLGQESLSLGIQIGQPVSLLGRLQNPHGKSQAFVTKGTCSSQHGQNFFSKTQRTNLLCCLHQTMSVRFLECKISGGLHFFILSRDGQVVQQ